MKKTALCFCCLLCLLCGCAAGGESVLHTTSPATQPTEEPQTIATTEETVPPDPMELLLQSMTTEEKVGQLFIVACPENAVEEISRYQFGGIILFGKDIEGEDPYSLPQKIAGYQAASRIPLLVAVDEEGGSVCRISGKEAFRQKRFNSPGWLLEQGGVELLLETEQEKSRLLHSLGINVNLAPVCDIATDPGAFMYSRSLRRSPEETKKMVESMLQVMRSNGVDGVLKHFPGYGNNTDTHTAMALDTRALAQLEQADLVPFRASGASAIMVSHTVVAALDQQLPASLSLPVHSYLRQTMGFEGVIMTDDLIMGAISNTFGEGEAAVLAVQAGNDLLCAGKYAEPYEAVLSAVGDGHISPEQLDAAVLRILRWKQSMGLLQE